MRVTSSLFTVLFATSGVFTTPLKPIYPYVVKDSHFVPRKWTRLGAAPAEHMIDMNIGLKQSQFDKLERELYEGDPSHFFPCRMLQSVLIASPQQCRTLHTSVMAST